MNVEWSLDKLEGRTYRQLQALAKENGVKANGKKEELVARLLEALTDPNEKSQLASNNDESMEELPATVDQIDESLENKPISPVLLEKDESMEHLPSTANQNDESLENVLISPVLLKKDESMEHLPSTGTQVIEISKESISPEPSNRLLSLGKLQSPIVLDNTLAVEENKLANSTYILETANEPSEIDDLLLTADESILAGNLEITQTLSTENQENTAKIEELSAKKKVLPDSAPISRPSRSQIPRLNGVNSARFLESHKKMNAKMLSIVDAKEMLLEKHQKTMKAVPASINRLAIAKNAREPIRRLRNSSVPLVDNLNVRESMPKKSISAKKPTPLFVNKRPLSVGGAARSQDEPTALKQVKKGFNTPVQNLSRIEQLATPKSAGSTPIPPERRRYTPSKSPFKYVDTSKMSDAEFQAYQRQQKSHISKNIF